MKHMSRKYKPEDAMLRPHKESTLEKQQKQRQEKNPPLELEDNNILNKKANQRMKRKEALSKAMNRLHDVDIVG
jgi:hypothetical protein